MRNTYLRDKEKGLWDEDAQAVNAAVIREIGDYELAVKKHNYELEESDL